MRGDQSQQDPLFTMLTPEQLVPARHPIRRIKPIVDAALAELSPTFDRMYAHGGRPSIPPERLLKGCLLIALYSIRSERQFCERLQYDLNHPDFGGDSRSWRMESSDARRVDEQTAATGVGRRIAPRPARPRNGRTDVAGWVRRADGTRPGGRRRLPAFRRPSPTSR